MHFCPLFQFFSLPKFLKRLNLLKSLNMISREGKDFDIIIVTGEYYDDHPLSGVGIIARVLDAKGFSVGIIEKPYSKEDFTRMGRPKLCFCVTSGSIDSMLNNYTPLKRKRVHDKNRLSYEMPDRAVIFYCNKVKEYFKGYRMVIGGIEASLRRFAHYDYWENRIRRSILFDSRADILVYGNGEKQVVEIAERLKEGKDLKGIKGTCVISKEADSSFEILPSSKDVEKDKVSFCRMCSSFSNYKNLAQEYDNNYLLQYKFPDYDSGYLDWVYSLGYSRKMHPKSLLKMAKFSVVTHRGCVGRCSFCSVCLHQGDKIISRSEKSILDEIRSLVKHPDFKGYIDDLGGASANMYGMDCDKKCLNSCIRCRELDTSHGKLLHLLRAVRSIKGVKKVFIRSGIRYDLAWNSKEYIREVSQHHVSGCLKISPEHFSKKVLKLMNKDNDVFDDFVAFFEKLNRPKRQGLRYYFMIGHPGDSLEEVYLLRDSMRSREIRNMDQFQLFTPTPMTISSCMYWTGLDPMTMKKVGNVHDYHTKKKLKRVLLGYLK